MERGKHELMSLLEELSKQMGYSYLSDLHYCATPRQLCFHIDSIPAKCYSLKEWQDTAAYFGLGGEDFQTAEKARDAILRHLKEPDVSLTAKFMPPSDVDDK